MLTAQKVWQNHVLAHGAIMSSSKKEECSVTIHEKIQAYYGDMAGEHDRYRSWEHCYRYFHGSTPRALAVDRDHAALQLGFYLASWGMYRGSSFLLQYTYTAHLGVVDQLLSARFSVLWEEECGAGSDLRLVPVILEVISAVRDQRQDRPEQGDQRRSEEGHDALLPTILRLHRRFALDDHVPRRLQIFQDGRLNPLDLHAEHLDQRTPGIPGYHCNEMQEWDIDELRPAPLNLMREISPSSVVFSNSDSDSRNPPRLALLSQRLASSYGPSQSATTGFRG